VTRLPGAATSAPAAPAPDLGATPALRPADGAVRCLASLEWIGETAILRLPAAASAQLPSRGQVAVSGSINGHPLVTVIEPDGRRGHWLKLAPGLVSALTGLGDGGSGGGGRAGGGAGGGGGGSGDGGGAGGGPEDIDLVLIPTRDWPEPAVPDDFAAALSAAPEIAPLWQAITPMARWEWVRWINATRNPQTRAKRVAVTISKMHAGKRRPCCFDLSACTDPELSRGGKLIAGAFRAAGG
jgi:hypothetical protein